jgi:hypothetical protein
MSDVTDFTPHPRKTLLLALGLCGAGFVFTPSARADRVFLAGGTVLDGKAVRKGDKVVVRLESGEITVPADSVERIEKSESVVSHFDAMYGKLPKGNAKARLELADYCRDHAMRTEEHRLLLEVIDLDRDNASARARLGFVKSEGGWITEADAMRAKGMVEHDGQWMTQADVAQLERARVAREAAAERRESEEADLALRRQQLDAQQAELDAEAARLPSAPFGTGYYPYYNTFYPTYGRVGGCFGGNCGAAFRPARPAGGFATHHFQDTSLSVVKVPYRHH